MRTRRRNQFNKRNSQYLALGAAVGMLIAGLVGVSIKAHSQIGFASKSSVSAACAYKNDYGC